MLRISGPVSVSIFHLQDDKKIYFFGDVHETKTGLCRNQKKVDKVFITDFIDSFQSSPTDVFLESDWVLDINKYKVPIQKETDVLRTILNHYKDKMYSAHDNKNIFRVHYTDIRTQDSFLELYLAIQLILSSLTNLYIKMFDKHPVNIILRCFPTLKTLNKFTDIIVKSDNYKQDMNRLLKDDTIFAGSNVLASTPGQTERKIHRIRKQILKLTVTDRNKLMAYHRETIHELYEEYRDRYNTIIKKMKGEKTQEDDIKEVASIILQYISHIMDMYALSRMIYYIKNSDSKTFISYAGAIHSANYASFFYYFWQKESKLVHNQYAKEYKNGNYKRCVSIPRTLL